MSTTGRSRRGIMARALSAVLYGILPILVVAGGALGAYELIRTAPQVQQRPAPPVATPVQTRLVAPGTARAVVEALGTAIAAQRIILQPQVSGVVLERHAALVPGGRIEAGELIVVIDPADYEIAVRQAEAALERAEVQLRSAEWELERVEGLQVHQATNVKELNDARTALAAATSDVAATRAALERAKLDLARTTLTAPFSCVVVDENVDVGAFVTAQTQLATLVGTDEYWVRVAVPVEQLRWIRFPGEEGPGSAVRVMRRLGSGVNSEWSGEVVRLLGDLEPQGRMARLLVSVPDPLGDGQADDEHAPLLLGSYVEVAIAGRELRDVFAISREELRDGDTAWIVSSQGKLDIRPVDVIFRGRDHVLVRAGLEAGERLVTSDLSSPVAGMALRLTDGDSEVAGLAAPAGGPGREGSTR